jgi:hypothetical protein
VVNSTGFGGRGLGVRESGLDQDPYRKKYTYTSITRVPVVQIEQMRAHLKGLSARIVMSSESMVTCASGLLPNPAKVPYFQYKAWWYSIVQKFHNEVKKNQDSQFWAYFGLRPWSGLSPKITKIGHDGILSIGNFILVIKNQILLFQLPGNWPTTKKCAPYFRGNMEFPIYSYLTLIFNTRHSLNNLSFNVPITMAHLRWHIKSKLAVFKKISVWFM